MEPWTRTRPVFVVVLFTLLFLQGAKLTGRGPDAQLEQGRAEHTDTEHLWDAPRKGLIEADALARVRELFPGVSPTPVPDGPWFCSAYELGTVRPSGFLLHVIFVGTLNRAALVYHGQGSVLLISEDNTRVARFHFLSPYHSVRLAY